MQNAFDRAISEAPLVPVVTIQQASDAVPLAEALAEGGIRCIEITLRTNAGLEAIRAIHKAGLKNMLVGAGTITNATELAQTVDAGAQFVVSPGVSAELLAAASSQSLCFLPGVVTPSEILQAVQAGQSFLKFFPAESFGGMALLKHYAAVFPNVQFCPTGGITQKNAKEYLALPNVRCVGGTWLSPQDSLAAHDWKRITQIARDSLAALMY